MRTEIINKKDVTDVIPHDVTPLTVDTDSTRYSRIGWLIVLLGIGGFLAWATFAPLDKGVPLSGTVAKEGNRKTIQYLAGGTVQDILVQDGDVVKKGQVLVRMNNVGANSQAEVSRVQYFTARAAEARLIAESAGAKAPAFPAALADAKNDPRVVEAIASQQQLFNARRQSLQSELGAYDENIAGLKFQIKGLEETRDSMKVQLGILKEQTDSMRDLSKDGYVARNRLLDVERNFAQVNGQLAETVANIGHAQRQVMEATLRRLQRTDDYQKEVRSQLADTQREADSLASRLQDLDYQLANTDVKAPVDGAVMGVNVFTRGGVVAPGAHMMDIVPSDDALVVEGQLAVNLIDKVHTGLPVELVFSAFNSNRTPHIPGIVTQVSADRSVDEHNGQPYYKVRAKVSPEGARLIAQKKLDIQPGMPVELFIKTGERTMMSYLFKPLFDRAHSSMSEE